MAEMHKREIHTLDAIKREPQPPESKEGMVGAVKDKAKEIASGAGEVAGQVKDKAQEWASTAARKVGDAKSAVGQGMSSLAGKIREKGPEEGMLGSAAAATAEGLSSAGDYLQLHGFKDMVDDVGGMIRRYPFQSLLVGLGLGFVLARLTRRD